MRRRKPEIVVAVDVTGAGDYVVTIAHEGGVVVVAHHQEEKDAISHGAELERALAWSSSASPIGPEVVWIPVERETGKASFSGPVITVPDHVKDYMRYRQEETAVKYRRERLGGAR